MRDLKTPDDYLAQALEYEEQAKAERDLALVLRCYRERDWFLNEAAKREQESP